MYPGYIPSEDEIARAYAQRYVSADDRRLKELFRLVELHFRVEHDPKFYAAKLDLSYRQLSRLTSARLGLTPNGVIQDRLHVEAMRLLRFTDLPMKEITYELGICDPSHFCRCFRKIEGISPTEFREVFLKMGAVEDPVV